MPENSMSFEELTILTEQGLKPRSDTSPEQWTMKEVLLDNIRTDLEADMILSMEHYGYHEIREHREKFREIVELVGKKNQQEMRADNLLGDFGKILGEYQAMIEKSLTKELPTDSLVSMVLTVRLLCKLGWYEDALGDLEEAFMLCDNLDTEMEDLKDFYDELSGLVAS